MKKIMDILKREQTKEFSNLDVVFIISSVIVFGVCFWSVVDNAVPFVQDLYEVCKKLK